jgi:hypothetical protein
VGRYAADTSVSTEASRAEIERTLRRYSASSFAYGWERERAAVSFEAQGRRVRFVVPLPDRKDPDIVLYRHSSGHMMERSASAQEERWEQACRQRWRALALVIKAKLEAIESGISTFDEEFLAHIVLPSGQTVGEWVGPQIDTAYSLGQMPALLPGT